MNRMVRAATAAAVIASATLLGGCSVIETQVPEHVPSAVEACAMGSTWSLDMEALQAQVVAGFANAKVSVSEVVVEGSQKLDWTAEGGVTITSDYTIRATAPSDVEETPYVVTQTISGVSTGRAFFSDVVAIPRDWDTSKLTIETTAVKGEEALEAPPFSVPKTIVDDVVGLEVQCTDDSMTTHGRGTKLTLTWIRAS